MIILMQPDEARAARRKEAAPRGIVFAFDRFFMVIVPIRWRANLCSIHLQDARRGGLASNRLFVSY
jgi:hypothetical protein